MQENYGKFNFIFSLPGKGLLSCSVTVQRYLVPPHLFHMQKLLFHPKKHIVNLNLWQCLMNNKLK